MAEQRTMSWYIQRLGKISSSGIEALMKEHKETMTDEELAAFKAANPKSRVTTKVVPFSEASYTYLDTKVMENYLPLRSNDQLSKNIVEEYINDRQLHNKAVEYGTLMESAARERYAKAMGYEVYEVGFIPYNKYPNLVGGSPDGMVREEPAIIEVKCPWTLEKHLLHMLYEKPEDLLENEPIYYWQCIANMLFTDTEFCDFISYCPYVSLSKQLKVLRIPRPEEHIKLLSDRIDLAVLYMKEKMQQLDNIQTIIK